RRRENEFWTEVQRKRDDVSTEAARRSLSKVWILNGTRPEHQRNYYFYCWFDSRVQIEEEFREATMHCFTHELGCDPQHEQGSAIIVGRSRWAFRNKSDIECVRSYLLGHGWEHSKP